ncbi:DUF4386 domain-containing protein [Myceligenerans indicum]|uniref:DUF4386 domain-containing protein n=1 Tax=Myceligenerans indicum TaxID=2593663 RepID=A0ABS1LIK8_9MICO|nr:DUF4386 domain-containing protein [Myceligenerans indicum]MBL0886021.1 DUF4386 domain-containing protein [Myceligenerans indicum]
METQTLDRSTARLTGLLYLAMAVVAVPGFMIIRPMIFDPDDPAATVAHLVENETLARVGIVLELGVVVTQVLVALWFVKLFHRTDAFAAASLGVFGAFNAITILGSAACLAAALDAALTTPFAADQGGAAQLMYLLSGQFWGVGATFFGLWLIPMGLLVLRARMPRALGWFVLAGGVAYLLSTLVTYLAPGATAVAEALPFIATIGEFWMIGWLIWYGVRQGPSAPR